MPHNLEGSETNEKHALAQTKLGFDDFLSPVLVEIVAWRWKPGPESALRSLLT